MIKISQKKLLEVPAQWYNVPVFEGVKGQFTESLYGSFAAEFEKLYSKKEISAEAGAKTVITVSTRTGLKKIIFSGLGVPDKITHEKIRRAAGAAVSHAMAAKAESFASTLWSREEKKAAAQLEGMLLASYVFDKYKNKKTQRIKDFYITAPGAGAGQYARAAAEAVQAVFLVRDLANSPANAVTPTALEQAARMIAKKQRKIRVKALSLQEAKKAGLKAFYAVARGSSEPAKFIIMEYKNGGSKKPLVFIGKGITFDTGGISLKPQASGGSKIEHMKFDMSGAATVIALMGLIAQSKIKANVVCIAPCTENMPDGNAYKPGDVIESLSGRTIEVISTDAEGRMVLCDAITYAQRFKPAFIVDIATLTGACMIALGKEAAGLMGTSEKLLAIMKKAGEDTGERVWELPLWNEYAELIKTPYADMKNIGDGGAGTIVGGIFLRQFAENTPWLHVDIANTAYGIKNRPYIKEGSSGFGLRLLFDFLKKYLKEGSK